MGYRSDVALVITRDKNKGEGRGVSIPEFLALAKLKDLDPPEAWKDYRAQIKWDDNAFLFAIDNVKWYEDYPEVQCIEELKSFTFSVEGLSYAWIRIGEELEDIEERFEGEDPPYGLLYVSRQLEVNVDIKPKEGE